MGNKGTRGLIYNIQRYSVHDGPGIRTTVFFKGCPLRCRWCQNPESIRDFSEIGYSRIKCSANFLCVNACPSNAIHSAKGGPGISIDREACKACREYTCVDACHNNALKLIGKSMSVEDVVNQVASDVLFYRNSKKGGVTLSGGEPLHQPLFALNLLKSCKEKGLHTVLDTSGYADWGIMKEILQFVDLVLYDIKCFSPKEHIKLTGFSNTKIIRNLKSIASKTDTPVIARIPLIPGCNDSEENIVETAKFLKDIRLKEVNVLPYHRLGVGKYKTIGKRYSLHKVVMPGQEHLNHLKKIFENNGLECLLH